MTIEFAGDNGYKGILRRHNGATILYGHNRTDIVRSLIKMAFEKEENITPKIVEVSWTDEDWENDFRHTERYYKHKEDNRLYE